MLNVHDMNSAFGSFKPSSMALSQYMNYLQSNSTFVSAASELYKLYQTNGLCLHLPNDVKLLLQNEMYLDDEYFDTLDFLMTKETVNSFGLAMVDKLQSLHTRWIYGPKTLMVMEEIGYSTRRNPELVRLVAQAGDTLFIE